MSTWTMRWGEDDPEPAPPVPYDDRVPHPVPAGTVRAVRVVIHGFHGIPDAPLIVAWDDRRATVRLPDGALRWYVDEHQQAFRRDGGIVVEPLAESVYPRDNRYMDALAVRSLEDLMETVNADTVTALDEDGTIHFRGEPDDSSGDAVREPDSGIILRASGVEGTRPWRLEVVATGLLEEPQRLLEPRDVPPPTTAWGPAART